MTNEEFIKAISLEGEEWRDIREFEGLYKISNYGRVVSLEREIFQGKCSYIRDPLLMKNHLFKVKKLCYFMVRLYKDGKSYPKTIHRLVAIAFIPNPYGYTDIDHINRNGLDNRVENLRWCTRKMNMENENTKKILAICHKGADKSYRWRPVVRLKDGVEIQRYRSITEATKDGFDGHNITQVCRGEKKSHRGYQWVYLDDYEKSISSSTSLG